MPIQARGQRSKSGNERMRMTEDKSAAAQSVRLGASIRTREASDPSELCRRLATGETAVCIEGEFNTSAWKVRVPFRLEKNSHAGKLFTPRRDHFGWLDAEIDRKRHRESDKIRRVSSGG